jgi:hypothetical protein
MSLEEALEMLEEEERRKNKPKDSLTLRQYLEKVKDPTGTGVPGL